jgi:predicted nucleotidyltransferase
VGNFGGWAASPLHGDRLNSNETTNTTNQHQVVRVHFQGHATVQLQGSTGKGTNTAESDVDLFVRMDSTLPDLTRSVRYLVALCLLLLQHTHTHTHAHTDCCI